jgi:hypothetical protein
MSWKAILRTRAHASCRLEAMADGIRALGGEPLFADPATPEGVHFVVSWGGSFVDAAWRGHWRGLGVPVLIMELGYLHRCVGQDDPEGYSQLGLDRIGWLPPIDCPPDRWWSLSIPLAAPVPVDCKALLVLGQVPHDAQHQLGPEALSGWLTEQAAAYAARGWRILFRPHPRHTLFTLGLPHERLEQGTLQDCLSQAGRVLTYNSTAGVEALMAGLPVVSHPSAHVHGVRHCGSSRQDYLQRLAYAQWNCAELASGEALQFMHGFAPLLRFTHTEAAHV